MMMEFPFERIKSAILAMVGSWQLSFEGQDTYDKLRYFEIWNGIYYAAFVDKD